MPVAGASTMARWSEVRDNRKEGLDGLQYFGINVLKSFLFSNFFIEIIHFLPIWRRYEYIKSKIFRITRDKPVEKLEAKNIFFSFFYL